MSRRTILWIVAGAVLFHAALFLVFGRMRALPKTKYIPPPNFDYREQVYENPRTGERTIFREIEVSTRLADPKKLPPPPKDSHPGERDRSGKPEASSGEASK